jgi:hypothetical protein
MEHNYSIDISGNTRIQDKKKLSVVALLIDKNSGKIVNAAKFKFDKDSDSGSSGFNFLTTLGDADGDGSVDVNDVTSTINHILGKPVNKFVLKAADVDGDDVIDVNDVQGIIDIALGKKK